MTKRHLNTSSCMQSFNTRVALPPVVERVGEVGGGGTGVTPCCMHEVTACIYIQGDEKPTLKWSFVNKNRREGYFCFFVT